LTKDPPSGIVPQTRPRENPVENPRQAGFFNDGSGKMKPRGGSWSRLEGLETIPVPGEKVIRAIPSESGMFIAIYTVDKEKITLFRGGKMKRVVKKIPGWSFMALVLAVVLSLSLAKPAAAG
jgi:hypothetical protein